MGCQDNFVDCFKYFVFLELTACFVEGERYIRSRGTDTLENIKKQFSAEEKSLLSNYANIAVGIARCFGSETEVVVHSLEDPTHSVIKIVNGHVTGRKVGAPLTDLALGVLNESKTHDSDVIGPYTSTVSGGKVVHSVTTCIRNRRGKLIGFLCINFNLSGSLVDLLATFPAIGQDVPGTKIAEHYSPTAENLIENSYRSAVQRFSIMSGVSSIERNRRIVHELYVQGLFNLKGSVDVLARKMGVTKFTVYNYLKDIRKVKKS